MMKTDRELLELAAKAAGYNLVAAISERLFRDDTGMYWGPLDDDGDALRLSIRLGLDVSYFEGLQLVRVQDCNGEYPACDEDFEDDIPAAVRLAIVRAAAILETFQ